MLSSDAESSSYSVVMRNVIILNVFMLMYHCAEWYYAGHCYAGFRKDELLC